MKRAIPWLLALLVALPAWAVSGPWPDGGGGFSTWFSSIGLDDFTMPDAVNQATWEWHHWSMKDQQTELGVFVGADSNDWASFDLTCRQGLQTDYPQFVYDFDTTSTCAAGPGGGTARFAVCQCHANTGTTYALQSVVALPSSPLWTQATPGSGAISVYTTDAQGYAYPKKLARLDFPGADECVTTENVNRPVSFQTRDNPVFYAEFTMWNYPAQLVNYAADLADEILFIGWVRDNISLATPGFNIYIDPTVSGVNSLVEAELGEAFGFMWVDSKWYLVFVNGGTTITSELVFDPVAAYGSLATFISTTTGGSLAFMLQTDIDNAGSGRRRFAYLVDPFSNSIHNHAQFTSVPLTTTAGSPISGYPQSGGVGYQYHRVVAACTKHGSTAAAVERFLFYQLDILK